jgi:hypothetical protein
MFIEINGHVVNENAIIQVSPEGHVTLAAGSGINCKDATERDALRSMLVEEYVPLTSAQVAAKIEEARIDGTLDEILIGPKDAQPPHGS